MHRSAIKSPKDVYLEYKIYFYLEIPEHTFVEKKLHIPEHFTQGA